MERHLYQRRILVLLLAFWFGAFPYAQAYSFAVKLAAAQEQGRDDQDDDGSQQAPPAEEEEEKTGEEKGEKECDEDEKSFLNDWELKNPLTGQAHLTNHNHLICWKLPKDIVLPPPEQR